MITVFRDYFKQKTHLLLWIMISALVIGLFPLFFKEATQTAVWAVRVNGEDIGYPEFAMEQGRQRERIMNFKAHYGEYADWLLSMMGQTDPKTMAANALISQELLNQFADKVGIYMSSDVIAQKMSNPEYIRRELGDSIPAQIIDPITGINTELLQRYIKHFRLTTKLFERYIERALLEKLMMNYIQSTLYVPLFDAKQKYQANYAKKSFSLFSVPVQEFLKKEKESTVSDDTLAKYYAEQNSKSGQYTVPEKRSGMQWTFDPKTYTFTVSKAEIDEHSQANKIKKFLDTPSMVQVRRILIAIPDQAQYAAMQTKAARIKDEILQDTSRFNQIAQRVSDDVQTAKNGGLLEPFARGSQELAFDRAAFLLPEDGAVSDVIETSRGLEILQRVKKTAPSYKPLASVRDDIEKALKQQKFNKQFMADMRKVIDQEETLAKFIADKGGAPKVLTQVSAQDYPQLFKLQEGKKTFFVDGDQGIAVRLDSIQKSHAPSLEAVRGAVLNDYYENAAKKQLATTLNKAKSQLKEIPFRELKKTVEGEFVQTGWLDPSDKKQVEKLKAKGLPIERMLQMEKVGTVFTHQDDQRGFVVHLDEIEPLDTQKIDEKLPEVAQSLKQERMQQYEEGFVASLHRNAKIETNESVITLQS